MSFSNSDLLINTKKQELLKKALMGVCKDIDYTIQALGVESNFTEQMKQRLEENPLKVLEEISYDKEIMKLINEWVKDKE